MTIGEANLQAPYRLLLYKSGSLYKCKSGITGLTEAEQSTMSTIWSDIKTIITNSGGPLYVYPNTNYSVDATLTLTSSEAFFDIWGTGNEFRTLFIPTGDFPVFDLQTSSYCKIKNIGLWHTQNTYTSQLLQLSDATTICEFENLYFNNASANPLIGNGVGFIASAGGQITLNRFSKCTFVDLDTCAKYDNTSSAQSNPWINSNTFLNCSIAGTKYIQRQFCKSTSAMAANDWMMTHAQSNITSTVAGFDYDNDSGSHTLNNIIGVILWDMPSGSLFVKANANTGVNLLGTTPTYKLGGSGLNNGANIIYLDNNTTAVGFAQLQGTGTQTDYTITHNLGLTPTYIDITPFSNAVQGRSFEITSKTTTQFTLRFHKAPPPSGDPLDLNNVKFEWKAVWGQ